MRETKIDFKQDSDSDGDYYEHPANVLEEEKVEMKPEEYKDLFPTLNKGQKNVAPSGMDRGGFPSGGLF
jgi:hypothetical protein